MADHETHPIFTVFTYPMNRPDAAALYEALYEVYDNKDKLEKVFKLCCDPIYWKEVPVRDLIANYWIGALDVLAREGALKTLCKKVQEDSQSENLLFVREAIQAVLSARQTTLTKKVFEEYRLVLDRKLLRTNLQELLSSNAGARRVFLVRGEKGSGKTWCRWLFEQMAEDAQAAPACYCDKNTAPTVKDLLNQLFSSFDVRVEIETDEQGLLRNVAIVGETSWKVPVETTPSGWYRALCLELKKLAADRKKPLWIIMDDLGKDEDNQPILDEQIRLFFEQFVLSMNNTATGQWFRLMLINYPDDRPARWKDISLLEEQTRSDDVQFEDVVDCMKEWALSKKLTLLEEDAIKHATALIQTARPEARLKHIHEGLITIFDTLKEQPV